MESKFQKLFLNFFIALLVFLPVIVYSQSRTTELFTKEWHFKFGDAKDGQNPSLDDSNWRLLDLPHDWSIEGVALVESKKENVPEFHIVKGEKFQLY